MADKKSAKYFCENCGSEVAAKAKFCPKCGRFFSSVRCPKCGKLGSVNDFKSGCPRCHYAMTHEDIYGEPEGSEETLDGRKHSLSLLSRLKIKNAFRQHDKNVRGSTGDGAPAWLFVASIIVLIGILVFIFYRCQQKANIFLLLIDTAAVFSYTYNILPGWWNWQTRQFQVLEPFRVCKFKSCSGQMALQIC